LADNDFYSSIGYLKSNNLPISPQTVSTLPQFIPCPKDENGQVVVNKTGLGSSATLVSSLVGAILVHFEVVALEQDDDDDDKCEGRTLLHNLAQIAHSLVQGKVGSGFDVSAALYGSHIYTRFDPTVIRDILAHLEQDLNRPSKVEDGLAIQFATAGELAQVVQDEKRTWNSVVESLVMPKGLGMMMADVCGGSESPSMARKVLQWKRERYSAGRKDKKCEGNDDDCWNLLLEANSKVKALFEEGRSVEIPSILNAQEIASLSGLSENELKQLAMDIQKDTRDTSDVHEMEVRLKTVTIPFLTALRRSFLQARSCLKQIGEASNVPIEPDEQTDLANLTMDVPGVIAAGFPGAGGYDALYVIYIQRENMNKDVTRDEIGRVWKEWCFNINAKGRKGAVCPLKCRSVGFEAMHGVNQRDLEWS
jgi:phosphomevalonate kinase